MPVQLGTVTDQYRNLHCIGCTPEGTLTKGARIQVTHPGGDGQPPINFEQDVTSVEIFHKQVDEVAPGTACGIKIDAACPLPPRGAEIVLLN